MSNLNTENLWHVAVTWWEWNIRHDYENIILLVYIEYNVQRIWEIKNKDHNIVCDWIPKFRITKNTDEIERK